MMKNVCCGLFLLSFFVTKLSAQKNYFFTTTDKVNLYIHEFGTGKPILFLGGGPGLESGYLHPICQKLTGYRFIIPDQRGTGLSVMKSIDSLNMEVDRYVEDLEALRRHLQLNKLVIRGHSWGGMLAYAYAAKYPANVDELVLVGPGGITPKFYGYFNSNITFRLHQEDNELAKQAEKDDLAAYLKAIWPGYFYNRARALATRNIWDSTVANKTAMDINKYTTKSYIATAAARVKKLRDFKRPVFIIQGRQDPIGESTVYETVSLLPQCKYTFIEKCGHLPWMEDDKAVNEFYRLLDQALKN